MIMMMSSGRQRDCCLASSMYCMGLAIQRSWQLIVTAELYFDYTRTDCGSATCMRAGHVEPHGLTAAMFINCNCRVCESGQ